MLNRLKLENFKAWREADLEFGGVTGFFGANSAGKSSLLQLLLLLKQTSNATDRSVVLDLGGPADLVSLGTFKDVIHRHDDQNAMSWLLDWTLPEKLEIHDPNGPPGTLLFEGDRLEIRCKVGSRQERMWAQELAYRFDGVEFKLQPRAGSKTKFDLVTDDGQFKFMRTVGRAWPLRNPVKTHLFPNEVRNFFKNADFLGDFELEYEKELPENRFDRSDRVFLAVAVRANGIVLNATDGDWSEQAALMDELDVEVEELCPQHACSKG